MYDVTELYDDLVAIRRTADVMREELPQESRDDLQVVIERIKGKLKTALGSMPQEDRHDIMYDLDREYCGGAWAELEALL